MKRLSLICVGIALGTCITAAVMDAVMHEYNLAALQVALSVGLVAGWRLLERLHEWLSYQIVVAQVQGMLTKGMYERFKSSPQVQFNLEVEVDDDKKPRH